MNSTPNAVCTFMAQRVLRKLFQRRSKSLVAKAYPPVFDPVVLFASDKRMRRYREPINCKCSYFHTGIPRMVPFGSKRGVGIDNQIESTLSSLTDDKCDDYQREGVKECSREESAEFDDIDEEFDEDGDDDKDITLSKSAGQYYEDVDYSDDEHFDTLIGAYLSKSDNDNDSIGVVISHRDAEEIRSCLDFLQARAKRKRLSRDEVDRSFQDAHISEKLLNLLISAKPSHQTINKDPKDRFVTVEDFNKVLTIWKYSTKGLKRYFQYRAEEMKDIKDHFKQMLQYQRRIACRCLYASERAGNLLNEMNRLSVEGYSYLRPTQYTYESVLGSWSLSSRELSFMLRGEGKAAGALQKVSPRRTLNNDHPELTNNPWDDPSILERYKLLDPAKKADELLEILYTLEELDSSEFKVSPWAIERTLASWVHVKTKPRRFTQIKSKPQIDVVNEDEVDYEQQEEFHVPARAEDLMWRLFDLSQFGIEGISPPSNSTFRSVISSWSHSNHPNGQ